MTSATYVNLSKVCTTRAFKIIAGGALGTIILLGAFCFIFGRPMTPTLQAAAGIVGAILGVLGVVFERVRSSN